MKQPNDNLKQKIVEWLDNQGYPLEIEVARVFESNRFSVSVSDIYEDFESGDDREIDIRASIFSSFKFNPVLRVHWDVNYPKISHGSYYCLIYLPKQIRVASHSVL